MNRIVSGEIKSFPTHTNQSSVFKLITVSAALDSGSVTMDNTYYCIGYKEVAGNKIHCWKRTNGGHGSQTLADAIKHSCNPAMIEVGQQTGVENFTTYFDRFGLGDLTGIDLLVKQLVSIIPQITWELRSLAPAHLVRPLR